MDAIEVKKSLAIVKEIDRLKDLMSESIDLMDDNEVALKELLVFCYDDYLSGRSFVTATTLNYMIKEYGEQLQRLLTVVNKLNGLDSIRSENLEEFRVNLNQFALSENIDINTIKGKFG